MIERLNIIKERYKEIEEELSKPEVLNDYSKMKSLSKEKSDLETIVNKYQEYQDVNNSIKEAKSLVNDPDLGDLAQMELEENTEKLTNLEHELELLLIPKDENDGKNIIMEIRGAAGGDEANIFAGDLFRMYSRYAEKQGWKTEVTNAVEGTAGGYSQIEFMIKGENVYSKLKFESGSHRVQRVPETESQGRIQTSTATVAVMPEAEEFDYELDMNEIRVDITRSSGCGGQGVNTTDSAVRLTHIPTGIVISCQDEKSQLKNKDKALKVLRSRLYELECAKAHDAEAEARRSQVGTGDRSEKIRTYNYPQSRVTDHRIKLTSHRLAEIMDGELDEIIQALTAADQSAKLAKMNEK